MPTSNFNQHFPDYEILGELGRSNARVLKAKHRQTGEIRAIKHFALNTDEDTIRRFQRESEIMTGIDHPNIVRIHEVHFDAELPYIVMEMIEGGDVRSLLQKQSSLDVATTIRLGLQMADALKTIHERGIIHRDIKPDNIMYRRLQSGEMHFLLTDFGIAKLREQSNTVTGQTLMTYEYASPEQFDNPKSVNEATDYYSLGVVFYECLSGKVPFSMEELGMRKFLYSVTELPPPALTALAGQLLPEGLTELVMGLLTKDVSERIAEIDQLVLSLEQVRYHSVLQRMGKSGQRPISGQKETITPASKSTASIPTNEKATSGKTRKASTVSEKDKAEPAAGSTKKASSQTKKKSEVTSAKQQAPPSDKQQTPPPPVSPQEEIHILPPYSTTQTQQLVAEADRQYANQNFIAAFNYYQKAAKQGDTIGELSMGHMHEQGLGTNQHYQQAFYWYQKAALHGNATAQNRLGWHYEKGHGVAQDHQQAMYWYQKASDQGNATGHNNLGHMYYFGNGTSRNYEKAYQLYQKAAIQDNGTGQFMLGLMHENGYGVPKNVAEAVRWYKLAAQPNKGNQQDARKSLKRLGHDAVSLADQQYNENNYAKAIELYREAAMQGDPVGQLSVAHMYHNGQGTAKDAQQALHWYQKSAEQGNATAQNLLGGMYQTGDAVTQNYQQALSWYQKAADQGNATGQNNVGHMYYFGYGMAKDYKQALSWYQKAADQQDGTGQYMLGVMHENGYGVPKNIPEAAKWYQLAAKQQRQNYKEAIAALKRLGYDENGTKPSTDWFSKLFGKN